MFGLSKEAIIDIMTPFGVMAIIVIAIVALFAAWVAITSESGDIRIDLEAINILVLLDKRWMAYERLMSRVSCSMNPHLLESALKHLCKQGKLESVKSKRTGRTFYRKAATQ